MNINQQHLLKALKQWLIFVVIKRLIMEVFWFLFTTMIVSLFVINLFKSKEKKNFSKKWWVDMFMFIPLDV